MFIVQVSCFESCLIYKGNCMIFDCTFDYYQANQRFHNQ